MLVLFDCGFAFAITLQQQRNQYRLTNYEFHKIYVHSVTAMLLLIT